MDYFTYAINPERMIEDYVGEITGSSKDKNKSKQEEKPNQEPIQVANDSQIEMTMIDFRIRSKNTSK